MKKKNILLFISIIVAILFLGIGYAEITGIELSIDGQAQLQGQTGVVITSIDYLNSEFANTEESQISSFYKSGMNSHIVLTNNPASYITYKVSIINTSNSQQKFIETIYDQSFYDNPNIEFELSNIDQETVIAPHEEKTFEITFKYKTGISDYSNPVLNSYLDFKFEPPVEDSFPIVFEQTGACTFHGSTGPITGDECSNYWDKYYIDTGISLLSEENYEKDFEVYFEIEEYNPNNQEGSEQITFFNSKLEDASSGYPGFVFRSTVNKKSYELTSAAVPGVAKKTVNANVTSTKKVKIVRKDKVLFYSFNDSELTQLQDNTTFNSFFDMTATFGASVKDPGNTPFRFLTGTLKNMYIRLGKYQDSSKYRITFDPNGGTLENNYKLIDVGNPIGDLPIPVYDGHTFKGWYTSPTDGELISAETVPEGNYVYYAQWETSKELHDIFTINGSCEFHATDSFITGDGCSEYANQYYIDTGIKLFDENNYQKDFLISFNIDSFNPEENDYSTEEKPTFVNAKYENVGLNYPGFVLRSELDSEKAFVVISSRVGQSNYTQRFGTSEIQNIRIKRTDQKLYYSINNGSWNYVQDYKNLNTRFDTPVTFGASLTNNNTPFRYAKVTLSNINIAVSD